MKQFDARISWQRAAIHRLAHTRCYIANSLDTEIVILEPR